jgi:hypothetical protein
MVPDHSRPGARHQLALEPHGTVLSGEDGEIAQLGSGSYPTNIPRPIYVGREARSGVHRDAIVLNASRSSTHTGLRSIPDGAAKVHQAIQKISRTSSSAPTPPSRGGSPPWDAGRERMRRTYDESVGIWSALRKLASGSPPSRRPLLRLRKCKAHIGRLLQPRLRDPGAGPRRRRARNRLRGRRRGVPPLLLRELPCEDRRGARSDRGGSGG